MDIDLKELEAFVAVVEKGSFSRAADVLFLTQPTVSSHIAALERKLEVKLVVRTTREIYPTDAGNILYKYAKEMLRLRESTIQAIQTFHREVKGVLTVAASTIPGQYYLPKLIQGFRSQYPEVSFNVLLHDSAEVASQIDERKVEIGFTGTRINLPKCVYHPLTDDRLVIITPNTPYYQAFLAKGFPLRQITEEPFISREQGSGTRMEMDAFLKDKGINPRSLKIIVEIRSTESIKQMVSQGLGIAVVSEVACEDYRQFGSILVFQFAGKKLRRKLYMIQRRNSVLSPIGQAFCNYVLEQSAGGTLVPTWTPQPIPEDLPVEGAVGEKAPEAEDTPAEETAAPELQDEAGEDAP